MAKWSFDNFFSEFQSAEEAKKLGNEAFKNKNYEDALTHYSAAIGRCPLASC
jgi:hypothetical protein